jgi:transforming growth factor-beta-induced protein
VENSVEEHPAVLVKEYLMTDKLSLIDTIAGQDKFSTFSRIMKSSGANDTFKGPGSFTVFAPTNDAFGKVPDTQMTEWVNEPGQPKLKALLAYHILPNRVDATNLPSLKSAKTVSGQDLTFTDLKGIKVNSSNVQARNIEATNGLIHAIDTVLAPPIATAASPSVL